MSHERQRRPFLNVGTVLLGILLIIAASGALISVGHSSRVGVGVTGARGSLGAPLIIATMQQGAINCPYGASFSPDGEHVAILGTQDACPAGLVSTAPHVAAIYNAHTGVMSLYVQLDKLLTHSADDASASSAQQQTRATSYFSLGWSPDGRSLAIVYTSFNSSDILTQDTEADTGLILLDTEHGSIHMLYGDSGFFALPGTSGGGFPIWNVATGAETPAFSPDPGLAYAWNAHGAPYPIVKAQGSSSELPISAGPRYPVGSPSDDSTFTIWQPGVILGSSSTFGAAIFTTVFPTWSPDGKYVTLMTAGAQLPLAQSSIQAQKTGRGPSGAFDYPTPAAMPSVPVRDAALAAVQRSVGPRGWAMVAWNPEGTLLASVNCQAPGNDQIAIRATDSGIIQGSAEIPLPNGDSSCGDLSSGASAYPAQPLMVLWSPSGDRVMVCDQYAATLTIWPVSQPAGA